MQLYDRINCAAPSYADDVSIVSCDVLQSQNLLDFAFAHSQKWRYEFNASKCTVTSVGKQRFSMTLSLGNDILPIVECITHMGVPFGKVCSQTIDKMALKGRKCTMMAASQGLSKSGSILDPSASSTIYWSAATPSMLYGIEVLPLSGSIHRQIAKQVQGLPISTPDEAVLPQIGWITLRSFIAMKKILFLCKILAMSITCVYKEVVLERLVHIRYGDDTYTSPIMDIYIVAQAYGLSHLFDKMVDESGSLSYGHAKKVVKTEIMKYQYNRWKSAILMYRSLKTYASVITYIEMCVWWKVATDFPWLKDKCRKVVSFLASHDSRYGCVRCVMCDTYEMETVEHIICRCPAFNVRRQTMFCKLGIEYMSENVVRVILCGGNTEGDKRVIVVEIAEMLEQINTEHESIKV